MFSTTISQIQNACIQLLDAPKVKRYDRQHSRIPNHQLASSLRASPRQLPRFAYSVQQPHRKGAESSRRRNAEVQGAKVASGAEYQERFGQ